MSRRAHATQSPSGSLHAATAPGSASRAGLALHAGLASLRSLLLAALIAFGLLAASAPAALAGPLQATTRILPPAGQTDETGGRVGPAGDVNGDGLADLLVSSSEDTRVFVVLGTRDPKNLDLPAVGASFELSDGRGKLRASPAGDVDGDGLADLLVKSSEYKWIAYGGRDVRDLTLDTTGSDPRVTFIKAPMGNGGYGPFTSAGDFDGDGKDDVLITRGQDVAIMFGGPRVPVFDATGAGPRIAKISGIKRCTWLYGFFYTCFTVVNDPVPIGDVNGDGKDDLFQPENKFITLGRSGTATMTSSVEAGATRLTNFGTGYYLDTDIALSERYGDLTGDGIDDLVLLKNGNTANHRYLVIPGSRTLPQTIDVATYPAITIADAGRTFWIRPAGDLTGDGRPELAATTHDGVRTLSLPTAAPASVAVGSGPVIPGVAEDPNRTYPTYGTAVGIGDTDGDGQRDLAFGAPFMRTNGAWGAVFLLTRGADQIPPELAPKPADPDDQSFSQVTPKRFEPGPTGAGTTIRLNLLEAADVELQYRRASGGAPLATERRSFPKGVTDTTWDGLGKGVNGVPGEYVIDATPIDAAGNRGMTKPLPFEITDGSAPAPATLEFTVQEAGAIPAGIAPPVRHGWEPSLTGDCAAEVQAYLPQYQWEGPAQSMTANVFDGALLAGETCDLFLTAPPAELGFTTQLTAAQYPWRSLVAINGGPSVDVTALGISTGRALRIPAFKLNGGKNTIVVSVKWEPSRYPALSESTNRWSNLFLTAGPANAFKVLPAGGGLELTPASTFQRGLAIDEDHPFDPRRTQIDFDAVLDGSTTGGNGLAFFLFDGRGIGGGGPPLIDNTGAGLGFLGSIGTGGTAFALSTFKGSRNPSANFVGIASTATKSTTGYPIWSQTANPGKTLAATTTHVTITAKDGVVTVALDGVERLRRTMALPARARWGFSASTGNAVQRHVIKNLRMATL